MRNRDNTAAPRLPAFGPLGLTKRETAAIAAMQGLLSGSPEQFAALNAAADTTETTFGHTVAAVAMDLADDLFDRLDGFAK